MTSKSPLARRPNMLGVLATAGLLLAGCSSSGEPVAASSGPATSEVAGPDITSSAPQPPTADTATTTTVETAGPGTASADTVSSDTGSEGAGSDDTRSEDTAAGTGAGDAGVVRFDHRLNWRGGMIGSASLDGTAATVNGWLPGMTQVATCTLQLWQDGEEPANDPVIPAAIDVRATTGDEPIAAVLFSAKTRASGLTPEQVNVYLQTLDLTDCTTGERVDLLGGPIAKEAYAPAPRFVGATGDVLAVMPYPELESELPDGPALFGVHPATGETAWDKKIPGGSIEVRADYTDDTQQIEQVFDLQIEPADGGSTRALIDVATGEMVVEAEDFEAPSLPLGADGFLYTPAVDRPYPSFVHSGGRAEDTVVKGGSFDGRTTVAAGDGTGEPLVAGMFKAQGQDPALVYVTADGALTEILPADEVDALGLTLIGVSAGRVYVETSAEHLVIDLEGEQVGEPYEPGGHPYFPVEEREIGGVWWTLWAEDLGVSGRSPAVVITRDGKFPSAGP